MKPLRSNEIFGNWATLLLPIDASDGIDYPRLEQEIDAIIDARVDGIYSNGTAGEFYTQSEAEFDRVSALLADKCERAAMPFQIGVSHTSAQIALERLRRAKSLRPSAFQLILPDWFPVTDAEAIAFLERMAAEAAPIGLVLYNPPHAKRVLKPAVIAQLAAKIPALVGVKVAPGGAEWFSELGSARTTLSVFTPGHFLATHVPLGSSGAYSNVACLTPAGAQRWYRQIRTNFPAAQEVGQRMIGFINEHIAPFITREGYCNAAADKLLAAIGGWSEVGTRLRWPYRWLPQAEADRLRPIARRAIPEFFDTASTIS